MKQSDREKQEIRGRRMDQQEIRGRSHVPTFCAQLLQEDIQYHKVPLSSAPTGKNLLLILAFIMLRVEG